MLIELSITWIIGLNVIGWLVLQLGLAWAFTQLPIVWFNPAPAWGWERSGRFYEDCLAIKRWKDCLPDGGRWFAGGFAKSALTASDPDYLRRFLRETWRGEVCHWSAIACAPVFVLWNPWWGDCINFGYALAGNLPCILVLRYNRGRLRRLLARTSARTGGDDRRRD
ncbi:MAG: hypothetical protein U1G07_20835 [Verrucomicrobiota bacterium]